MQAITTVGLDIAKSVFQKTLTTDRGGRRRPVWQDRPRVGGRL
jgi:hypothetical protein